MTVYIEDSQVHLDAMPVSKTISAWRAMRRRDRGRLPKWVPPQANPLPIDDR